MDSSDDLVRMMAGSRELMDLEPIRKGLPQLHRDMKRLFDKLRSQASSTEGHVLFARHNVDTAHSKRILKHLDLRDSFEPGEIMRDTDVEGYMRHEREKTIVTAVQETRRTTLSTFEESYHRSTRNRWEQSRQEFQTWIELGGLEDGNLFPSKISFESVEPSLSTSLRGSWISSSGSSQAKDPCMEEFAEVVGRSLLDSDLNVAKEFAECAQHHPWVVEGISVKDLWDLMVCLTQERNPEDAPRVVFLRRGLEFLEQEYAHYLESEMGKGMAMGEPQELSPVLSYSRHQQLAAFGSDMEESPWADLYFAMRAGAMRMESCRRWILEHMSIPDQELIESYLLERAPSRSRTLQPYDRSPSDPFKRLVLSIVNGAEEEHPEIVQTIEDYVWYKLKIAESLQRSNAGKSQEVYEKLEATIKAHQQENSQKHDQCWSPLLYAKLLFLCSSPEEAIHYLLIFSGEKSTSRFRAEAVHFALVLDAVRLLRNSSSEDFRAPILSGKVLNLNGVLRHYVRELSTVRAVPYIRYMRGSSESVKETEKIQESALVDLILRTQDYPVLFGDWTYVAEEDAMKYVPGCLERYFGNSFRSIARTAAFAAEGKGDYIQAINLFHTAGAGSVDGTQDMERALHLLNEELGRVALSGERREQVKELAEALRLRHEEYQGNQRIARLLDTLLDLLSIVAFFDLYFDGQHEVALMMMAQSSRLVPSSLDQVEDAVLRFRILENCIKKNIPEVVIRLLESLHVVFRGPDLSKEDVDGIRHYAASLVNFAGRIHYAIPTNIHQRINILAKSLDV